MGPRKRGGLPPLPFAPEEWQVRGKNGIEVGNCVVLNGPRGTGKSVALIAAMYELRHSFDLVLGMNPSEARGGLGSGTLNMFVAPAYQWYQFDAALLERVFDCIEGMRDAQAADAAARGMSEDEIRDLPPPLRIALCIDDCASEKSHVIDEKGRVKPGPFALKTEEIGMIFKRGRHLKLTMFLILQNICDAPPPARNNTDVLIALPNTNRKEIKKLYEEFFGAAFRSLSEFEDAVGIVWGQAEKGVAVVVRKGARRDPLTGRVHGVYKWNVPWIRKRFRTGRSIYIDCSRYIVKALTEGRNGLTAERCAAALGRSLEDLGFARNGGLQGNAQEAQRAAAESERRDNSTVGAQQLHSIAECDEDEADEDEEADAAEANDDQHSDSDESETEEEEKEAAQPPPKRIKQDDRPGRPAAPHTSSSSACLHENDDGDALGPPAIRPPRPSLHEVLMPLALGAKRNQQSLNAQHQTASGLHSCARQPVLALKPRVGRAAAAAAIERFI